jgi:MtN3 and saliva related transmembrane protein
MIGSEVLGFAAATLTTLAFLPRVVRTWRTRSAKDFSVLWIALFGLGLVCWLAYGAFIYSLSLIAANGLTLALVLTIAWVKWQEAGADK